MATVRVDVSSSLGDFSFTDEVQELKVYGDASKGVTQAEIGQALDRAFSAARRAYEIEETS